MKIKLDKVKKIYFIGIKGVAMTGLAVICKQKGMEVSGSDVLEKFITDKILLQENIEVFEEFNARNLEMKPDLVVIGTSWDDDNVEVKAVKKKKLNWISDSEMRGLLSKEKRTIAITGVHGKTTTTALLSFLFFKAGLSPSFLIGTGTVTDLETNAAWGTGKHFIVEGDEYIRSQKDKTPKFLDLDASVSIITSLEWEHVDIYKDIKSMEKVFTKLVNKTTDLVVACGDWPSVKKIIAGNKNKTVTYGLNDDNFWQAYDIRHEYNQTIFRLRKDGVDALKNKKDFSIKLFGEHNVLNALSVIIVGLNEGIALEQIRKIIKTFKGAERRFDVSERNDIIFIDDYAHHPTEIAATLKAIRHRYPDKEVWCIFQPHMASRTKALLPEFTQSFGDVDMALFADIFSSAREASQDITSKQLAEETKKNQPNSVYVGDLDQAVDYLKNKIKPGMVLVTMGAGDVYRVRDQLLN